MKANIKYVDNPEQLKRWNFDEPAIEFSNENQHTAIPLSKVSGPQIKKMLDEWHEPCTYPICPMKNMVQLNCIGCENRERKKIRESR